MKKNGAHDGHDGTSNDDDDVDDDANHQGEDEDPNGNVTRDIE